MYALRRELAAPSRVTGAILILLFVFLVVISFLQIINGTSTWQSEDVRFNPGVQVGAFTISYRTKTSPA